MLSVVPRRPLPASPELMVSCAPDLEARSFVAANLRQAAMRPGQPALNDGEMVCAECIEEVSLAWLLHDVGRWF